MGFCKPRVVIHVVRKLVVYIGLAVSAFFGFLPSVVISQNRSIVVLTEDWGTHVGGNGWWAVNNTWGSAPFKNGRDFHQSITIDAQSFPNNTVMEWAWPDRQSGSVVYGYPEIVWGPKGTWNVFSESIPIPTKIKDLKQLKADFSVELKGNLRAADILMESFLTDVASPSSGANDKFEICFLLYSGPSIRGYEATQFPQYRFAGKFNAKIAVVQGAPPIVLIVPDSDIFTGTVDMLEVYRFLITKKIITGEEYIRAVEFGAESQGTVPGPHRGKLIIKKLNYVWQ